MARGVKHGVEAKARMVRRGIALERGEFRHAPSPFVEAATASAPRLVVRDLDPETRALVDAALVARHAMKPPDGGGGFGRG